MITSIFNEYSFGIKEEHSIFWLSIYHYYDAYIKIYEFFFEKYSKFNILLINLFSILINVLFIFLAELNNVKGKNNYYSLKGFKSHVNPFLIICAICDLILFKDLNLCRFFQKIISIISPSVFFVYILGFNFNIFKFYNISIINSYNILGIIWFLFYKNIYISLICLFIDYIRRLIFHFSKMNIFLDKLSMKIEGLFEKCLIEN